MLRLSFGGGNFREPGYLSTLNLMAQVAGHRTAGGRPLRNHDHGAGDASRHVIEAAARAQTGQRVAVLVDEYDKPILDVLDIPDVARANRDYLRGLYACHQGHCRSHPLLVPDPA